MNSSKRHICKHMKTCQTLDALYPPTIKCAKFRRKFRELFLVSEENGRKCFTPQGNAGYIYQKEKQLIESPRMIHPYSKFCQFWEVAAILEFCISYLLRPFLVSLHPKKCCTLQYQIPSLFSDLFQTTDVLLRFRIGYMDKDMQEVVLDSRKVFSHIIKKPHFYTDLLVSLPVQFVAYIFACNRNLINRYFNFIVLCKILKIYAMINYLTHLAKIYNWSELFFSIVWTLFLNLFLCHCIVCAFCLCRIIDFFGWLFELFDLRDRNNCFFTYIRTFYTIIIAFTDREAAEDSLSVKSTIDKLFYCVMVIVMNFSSLVVIGMFLQLLAFMRNSAILFIEMKQEVQKFLAQESLPKHIHVKTMKYLDFRYNHKYFNEDVILKTLSPPLKREVMKFLCYDLLKKQKSIFKSLPDDLATDLCLLMKLEYYLPGDAIQIVGKKAKKVYFLYSGSVAVYNVYGKEIMHWYEGQQFGISCFLKVPVHSVTTIALEMTELYTLRYTDFVNLTRDSPMILEEIEAAAIVQKEAYSKFLLSKK